MVSKKSRSAVRVNKHRKLRNRLSGTPECPRLAVFRSNNHMYAQIIDDTVGHTLVSASTLQKEVKAELNVKVLSEGEEGFKKYDVPAVNKFSLMGYKVNKAFYAVSSSDRDIGVTDGVYNFGNDYSLSMFPSESCPRSPSWMASRPFS